MCPSVQLGALCGVLIVLGLLLVYAVHRLPHDWTGSATLSIIAYFVQLSAMVQSKRPAATAGSAGELAAAGRLLSDQSVVHGCDGRWQRD